MKNLIGFILAAGILALSPVLWAQSGITSCQEVSEEMGRYTRQMTESATQTESSSLQSVYAQSYRSYFPPDPVPSKPTSPPPPKPNPFVQFKGKSKDDFLTLLDYDFCGGKTKGKKTSSKLSREVFYDINVGGLCDIADRTDPNCHPSTGLQGSSLLAPHMEELTASLGDPGGEYFNSRYPIDVNALKKAAPVSGCVTMKTTLAEEELGRAGDALVQAYKLESITLELVGEKADKVRIQITGDKLPTIEEINQVIVSPKVYRVPVTRIVKK